MNTETTCNGKSLTSNLGTHVYVGLLLIFFSTLKSKKKEKKNTRNRKKFRCTREKKTLYTKGYIGKVLISIVCYEPFIQTFSRAMSKDTFIHE